MNMKNAIVAAYVKAYEANWYGWTREEMLEQLVVELTERLELMEEQEAIEVASK